MHRINYVIHVEDVYDVNREEWEIGQLLGYEDEDTGRLISCIQSSFCGN